MRRGILYEMYRKVPLQVALTISQRISNTGIDDIATSLYVIDENYVSNLSSKCSHISKR